MLTFESLLAALARSSVRFLVVGGLAVAQAGFARFIEDVALLVDTGADNLTRLLAMLADFGDGAATDLTPADFPLEEGAIRIVDEFVIDRFTQMSGLTFGDLRPLADWHDVDGTPVLFLGRNGLLRLKEPSLRPRDQADAAALRALQAGRDPHA